MSLETKRREYAEYLDYAGVTHERLKDYFSTHARALSLDRESDEFKTLKNHLKTLDPNRTISREINYYYDIYSRLETLKRELKVVYNYRYGFFDLQPPFRRMLSLVNPINYDNYNFQWSILAAIHHKDLKRGLNRRNISNYRQFLDKYDFSMVGDGWVNPTNKHVLSEFEHANNIALFIISTFAVTNKKRIFSPDNFAFKDISIIITYQPTIEIKDAKNVVYLAHFADDSLEYQRYVAIVSYRGLFSKVFTYGIHNITIPYMCLRCKKEYESMELLHKHYDEVCRHN